MIDRWFVSRAFIALEYTLRPSFCQSGSLKFYIYFNILNFSPTLFIVLYMTHFTWKPRRVYDMINVILNFSPLPPGRGEDEEALLL